MVRPRTKILHYEAKSVEEKDSTKKGGFKSCDNIVISTLKIHVIKELTKMSSCLKPYLAQKGSKPFLEICVISVSRGCT